MTRWIRIGLTGCLVSVVTTLALAAALEGVCGWLNRPRPSTLVWEEGRGDLIDRKDPGLGYRPMAERQAMRTATEHGKRVAEITYTTDEQGRRRTPGPAIHPPAATLLFFGDSFTFGENVGDEETMPHAAARFAPHVRVYNYGVPGYGPQHVLAKLEGDAILKEFEPVPPVIGVYTFIGSHVRRATGSMRYYASWMADSPYYELDARGTGVVRKGSFRTGQPWRSRIYGLLGRTQTIKYLKFDWPVGDETQRDLELACRIIEAARDRFQALFNSDRFYVLLYPNVERRMARVGTRLRELGVRTVDYSTLVDPREPRYRLPGDRHPTPEMHGLIARQLITDLGLSPEAE